MEAGKLRNWEEITELGKVKDSKETDALEKATGQKEGFIMLKGRKDYTIADIEALPEGERAELIDGELFRMDAPSWTHQDMLMQIAFEISLYIKKNNGNCKVLPAPFAVYIKKDKYNYVEPDISVICDEGKKSEKGCQGAPDWTIEILSPSSVKMDCERKVKLYREAGVREYWIVDPETETVMVYNFEDVSRKKSPCLVRDTVREQAVRLEPTHYSFTEPIKVGIFEDMYLQLSEMDLG